MRFDWWTVETVHGEIRPMMNIRSFGLALAFVGIFCVWTLFAIQFTASFSSCNPGYGCRIGAPIETTIGIIIVPGILLLSLFIAVLLRNREASLPSVSSLSLPNSPEKLSS